MNICVEVFMWEYVLISPDYRPGSGIAELDGPG
jgi:hypothetical protein